MTDRNLAYSTVLTPPSPATTGLSLVLQSGDGANMPPVPFDAEVWPEWPTTKSGYNPVPSAPHAPTAADCEIVTVTGVATDTLTITRAQRGTNARSIIAGDQFRVIPTNLVQSAQNSGSDTLYATVATEQNFATTYTLPANLLTTNKLVRVTAILQQTTGNPQASNTYKLKLGGTPVYTSDLIPPTASKTNVGIGFMWQVQGTAVPGASVNVESGIVTSSAMGTASRNVTPQPVALATNGTLQIQLSLTFSATNGTDSVTLRQLIVEVLN